MKETIVITGYDDKAAPIGDLTSEIVSTWSKAAGFDFECSKLKASSIPVSWAKVNLVRSAFESGYKRAIWLDADTIITNPNFTPSAKEFGVGLHLSRDWGTDAGPNDFSCGNFIASASTDLIFKALEEARDKSPEKPGLWEQAILRDLWAKNMGIRAKIKVHPRRLMNAVPAQVHPSVVEPWQPGDWLCHLTMIPVEDKVKLFHKIKATL